MRNKKPCRLGKLLSKKGGRYRSSEHGSNATDLIIYNGASIDGIAPIQRKLVTLRIKFKTPRESAKRLGSGALVGVHLNNVIYLGVVEEERGRDGYGKIKAEVFVNFFDSAIYLQTVTLLSERDRYHSVENALIFFEVPKLPCGTIQPFLEVSFQFLSLRILKSNKLTFRSDAGAAKRQPSYCTLLFYLDRYSSTRSGGRSRIR